VKAKQLASERNRFDLLMRYSPFFGLAACKTWFCLIGGTWLGEDCGVATVWRLYPVDLTMDLSSFK
jgi:hypothetical protein